MLTDPTRAPARFRAVAIAAGIALAAYWIAAFAGVPSAALSLVFTVTLPLVPPIAWWAVARALPEHRTFVLLATIGITFQGIGSVLWYVAFLQNGSKVPDPPGYWTPFLHVAIAMGAAAAWVAVRKALRPGQALLDYSVVVAAGACLAVAVFEPQLHSGWSATTFDAAGRPILNVLLVTVIVSAAIGRWQTLPLPVGLLALGQLFSASGDLLFAFESARGTYDDDRWTNLLWITGAVIAIVTAASVILRIDRPIRFTRHALPGVSPLALLLTNASAWSIAAAVAVYGAVTDRSGALYAGVAAAAWIGLAALIRTLGSLRETRSAYQRLDAAHLALETIKEQHDGTIAELAQRNIELTAVHAMLGSLLQLADERSDGELRSRLEESGQELMDWLPGPDRGD